MACLDQDQSPLAAPVKFADINQQAMSLVSGMNVQQKGFRAGQAEDSGQLDACRQKRMTADSFL